MEHRIRALFDTWPSADLEGALELFADHGVLEQPPYALDGGDRRGRDELEAAFRNLFDRFEYESVEIHEVTEGPRGTLVAFTSHGRGRASGVPIEQNIVHVYEFSDDGLIEHLAWFFDRAEAVKRAGLPD